MDKKYNSPPTAEQTLEMALRAHYTDGEMAEAISLYQAAAQLFTEEGAPSKVKTCQAMERVVLEMSDTKPHASIAPRQEVKFPT